MNIYINASKMTFYREISSLGKNYHPSALLQKNLGISVITVENAYEQLIAEGYIYSMPKRGFYVTDFKKVCGNRKKKISQKK